MTTRESLFAQLHQVGGHDFRIGGPPYCTIHLPEFEFLDARRNTQERLNRFGVDAATVGGKTVLDLGCNTGGVAFECARLGAGYVEGLDLVAQRVDVARQIAEFCGLAHVNFRTADVLADPDPVARQFDLVFCLALDGWVADRDKLFQRLGNWTLDTLYLETHDGMVGHTHMADVNVEKTVTLLKANGFQQVLVSAKPQYDEANAEQQHYRPNIIARKPWP